ncbi:MAG TPA: hypothetical protein VJ347_04460, partial [Streptosporangiaceae bacterium]|nr:hypothetical protein [Streptosporangiaceae bacterium]
RIEEHALGLVDADRGKISAGGDADSILEGTAEVEPAYYRTVSDICKGQRLTIFLIYEPDRAFVGAIHLPALSVGTGYL